MADDWTVKKSYGYILANIVTALILIYVYKLDLSLLSYPFKYDGDALDVLRRIKMVVDGEYPIYGIAETTRLSLPFGFRFGDFPVPVFSFLLLIKAVSFFTEDPFIIYNTIVLISFFAATNVMYFVLRLLGINLWVSLSIAILFSFTPFHIFRLPHTGYTLYFYLPILIYFILKIWDEDTLIQAGINGGYKLRVTPKLIAVVFVIVLTSLINFYYTFFLCFLVFAAMISSYVNDKSKQNIFAGMVFLALLILPVTANLLPYHVYEAEFGNNHAVGQRKVKESEIYGLKIAQLILPLTNHRVDVSSDIKRRTANNPLSNENNMATLGLVASIGFLFLLLALFKNREKPTLISKLAILNISAVMLGTIGGFSSVFATLISPQIRGYNRISIIIATLSLMAVAVLIDRYLKNKTKLIVFMVSISILFIGIFDQTTRGMRLTPPKSTTQKFDSDEIFVNKIEHSFDYTQEKGRILQLPFMPYPEHSRINNLEGYEHFVDYLHSEKLSWSFGAINGRESHLWLDKLSKLSIEEIVEIVNDGTFNGILINRIGYEDHGKDIIRRLEAITKKEPLISDNGLKVFFKLSTTGGDAVF
jgi:hypothetical protein